MSFESKKFKKPAKLSPSKLYGRKHLYVKSHFLNTPFIFFLLVVLILSISLILDNFEWLTLLIITVSIFVINFFLGYHTVRNLLIKKNRIILMFLFLLSYVIVPFTVVFIVQMLSQKLGWQIVGLITMDIYSITFGVNLLANTFFLMFYYTNTTVVFFEEKQEKSSEFKDLNPFPEKNPSNLNSSSPEYFQENSGLTEEKINLNTEAREYLLLRSNRALTRVRFDGITYLEVNLNTVLIQTIKRFYETRSTLGEILQGLPENFVQVNKSVVINLTFFDQLTFENDTKRSKVKIVFPQENEMVEESFYLGRKFVIPFKQKLSQ